MPCSAFTNSCVAMGTPDSDAILPAVLMCHVWHGGDQRTLQTDADIAVHAPAACRRRPPPCVLAPDTGRVSLTSDEAWRTEA
ncbi:hypothetical protein GCM10023323_24500 [Streptomyces thinghirensis]|uniref:DUF397 domain-containing protein n=1 Tax=Streptomyces thinghirensis TaxID=551547 RepID=A0ABP9T037_9ACTN